MSTTPPFAAIRMRSSARPGLWSSDKRLAASFWPAHSTALESPTLQTKSLQPLPEGVWLFGTGKITQVNIVEPSSQSFSRALERNSSSVRTHASSMACRKCSSVKEGFAAKHFCILRGSHSTTASTHRLPECPSKTQNPTTRSLPEPGASSSMSSTYLSSCTSLFPCHVAEPAETVNLLIVVSCTSVHRDPLLTAAPVDRSATCCQRFASNFS
mmetsp:Transcript_22344/g.51194  ORF Transcript_22344/g.51194 Transcript_22344/m.51194 type:complete len:213 (-) Transcript_22344:365-1003(-)